ncbi:MAG: hypothetical protein MI807_05240, partial [Verrucomicrobiales bacterium]|nr:hypothetical protein [Verrucomicrobiales bacterium]
MRPDSWGGRATEGRAGGLLRFATSPCAPGAAPFAACGSGLPLLSGPLPRPPQLHPSNAAACELKGHDLIPEVGHFKTKV